MKVSVVIRVKNELFSLKECVARLNSVKDLKIEIIVVDSGSIDGTLEFAQKVADKVVIYHWEKWSWGRALNVGIQSSSGDFILSLSAHCFLIDPRRMSSALRNLLNNDVAALYGVNVPVPGVNKFEELELQKLERFKNQSFDLDDVNSGKCQVISNSCAFFRKSDWVKQKFDESIESLEDFDWILKVMDDRLIVYSEELAVFHSHIFDYNNILRREYHREYQSLNIRKSEVLYRKIHFLAIVLPYWVLTLVKLSENYGLFSFWRVRLVIRIAFARVSAFYHWSLDRRHDYWDRYRGSVSNSSDVINYLPERFG